MSKSIYVALKKRPIDTETVEKFISKISRSLEELGQNEISSNTIGTMVMEGLKSMDPVAYVRFASVCLLYTSPSPRDRQKSRMPSSA